MGPWIELSGLQAAKQIGFADLSSKVLNLESSILGVDSICRALASRLDELNQERLQNIGLRKIILALQNEIDLKNHTICSVQNEFQSQALNAEVLNSKLLEINMDNQSQNEQLSLMRDELAKLQIELSDMQEENQWLREGNSGFITDEEYVASTKVSAIASESAS